MAYVSKVWVDRQTEYPTRRKLEFDDGTDDKIVTVSRAEGTIYEAGDIFDANTMNTLESRIAAGIAEKQDILIAGNGIRIDQDNVISATGGGGGIEFTKIESGSLVSVNDAADLPVVDLAVEIKAVQSGTGDPSPSNVRPISGWSSVNVKRCSKNLVDIASLATTNITYSNGVLTGTGLAFSQAYSNGFISVPTTGQITVTLTARTTTGTTSNNGLVVCFKYTDGTQASLNFSNDTTTWETKTITSSASKVVSYVLFTYAYESANTWEIKDLQVELGAPSTAVESYTGTTVSIALGQTVYGGELDVTSGVLTITWVDFYFDGSESVSAIGQSSGTYYTTVTKSLTGINSTVQVPHIKSDKFLGATGVVEGHCYVTYNGTYLVAVLPQTVTTTQQATEWFQSNPTHFVYELAQPVTVQLTPTEVETLLGINNIWSDSGDILNLEYYTQSASDVRDFIIKDEETTDDASWSSEKIQNELDAKQETLTAGDGIVISQNNEISAVLYKELTATLNVFSTSVVFEDASITTSSVIDIYTSKYGFNPETVTAETGRLTITFRQPEEQITVKVRIS